MKKKGCVFEGGPICAVNANSSNPHYVPTQQRDQEIRQGDFILIDLWGKKDTEHAIYADLCKVAVASSTPTPRQQQVFSLVRRAQKEAIEFIVHRFKEGVEVFGWEVDLVARKVIEEGGFGPYFIHRTGHNIYEKDHGPGTHMDSFETFDDRKVLRQTCFSIEPGVYLPGEFGVRLECDLLITKNGEVEVSGGVQEGIHCLF
jgi:Xaa-Pro aminopeptidase